MCLGFSLSVLVLLLLTLLQHANANGDRREGSSGYTNVRLAFPSAFESSAQNGVFLGSSRASQSAGGQVVGYSPEGSVSSYGSSSLNVRKPTQNSQQPRQTNPNAKGVIQSKAGMWDYVSPKNVKRIASQQPSYQPKPQQSGYQPKPQQHGYQSPSVYQPQQPKPQQPGYPSLSVPKPQQPIPKPTQSSRQSGQTNPDAEGVIQTKAGMWDFVSPKNVKRIQAGYQAKPQQPVYQPKPQQHGYQPQQHDYQSPSVYQLQKPKPQQPSYPALSVYQPKPQQPIPKPTQNSQQSGQTNPDPEGVIQTKAGMWDFVSPKNVKRIESQQASYQSQPQQPSYQPKSQQPGYPSLSVYQPKHQQQIPKPTQNSQQSGQTKPDPEGVIQTKAGMWDFVSPKNVKRIQSQQAGYQPKPQQPSYQPKPQQHGYQPQQPKPQQPGYPSVYQPQQQIPKPTQSSRQSGQNKPDAEGVIQTKAGMWDFVSPKNVKRIQYKPQQPSYQPKPQQHGHQSPSVYQPQQPKPQQPGYPSLSIYQPKPQRQIPKPTQNSQQSGQTKPDAEGVIQTKAGMWDFVSPKNVERIQSQQAGYQSKPQQPQQPRYQPKPQQPRYQPKPQQPRYQPKPQQHGHQSPSVYQPQQPKPQQPGYPSLSIYQPKPQRQIPKPTQNSQQSGQTKPDAEGVIQTKAGMWDFVSPKNVERIRSQQAGYQPQPQQPGYQPKPQQPRYQPKPQQHGYQSPSVYQPQQPKPQQPGYPSLSIYQPKPQRQIPKPAQNSQQSGQTKPDAEGVIQTKAGMWDFVSPKNVERIQSQQAGYQSKPQQPQQPRYQPKPQQPRYQPKPQQHGYQSPSVYQPQQPKLQKPGYPSIYQTKPQRQIPKPTQNSQQFGQTKPDEEGVIQTKAGMWDFVSPKNVKIIQSQQAGYQPKPQQPQQPGYQPKPQQPSYQPKPQQHGYQPKPQQPSYQPKPQQHGYQSPSVYQPQRQIPKPTQNSQQSGQTKPVAEGVIQTKAGMWDFVAPKNVDLIKSQQAGYQPPSVYQPGYPFLSVHQPKPTQNSQKSGQTNPDAEGVLQTKAGMWDFVSPKNGTRLASGVSLSRGIVFDADRKTPSESKPSVYQPKAHQVEIQMNAILEFLSQVSGRNIQPTNLNVQMTVPPRTRGIRSPYSPRWQQSVVPV